MWSRSYRNHVIMAFPSFDTLTNSWAPQADISWCSGADRESEFVRFRNRVMTENEAVSFALRRSVVWINQHLKQLQEGHAQSPQTNEIKSLAALKEGLKRLSVKRTHAPLPDNSASSLTYQQFKSLMVKLGFHDSEQSLHKSYEALIALRKTRRCSWTEIRKKVEHSREVLSAANRSPRRIKQSRLPLTSRAWQRIA